MYHSNKLLLVKTNLYVGLFFTLHIKNFFFLMGIRKSTASGFTPVESEGYSQQLGGGAG